MPYTRNSICHSRKRLVKLSIFSSVFRLFPLISDFHLCSKSGYSIGFSCIHTLSTPAQNLGKNYFHRFALLERVLSPDSPLLLLPPQREGGDAIHCNSPVAFYLPSIFRFIRFIEEIITFAIEQIYDSLQAQCLSFYFACPSVLKTSDSYMMNRCSRQELFPVSYEPFIPSCVSQQAHCLILLLSDCAHADSQCFPVC